VATSSEGPPRQARGPVPAGGIGGRLVRFEQTDDAGQPTGRSASFAGVQFAGLQYADLIDHTLGTPINVPLKWTDARVVESNFEGLPVEAVGSAKATLESPYSSRTIGLVRDGWLPSGVALQDDIIVLPDRCTVSELAGRFRGGKKTDEGDKDFLDLFADQPVRINPLFFALEGNLRRNPSPEVIEQQLDHACSVISAALPLAQLVPGRSGLQGVIGIVNDTDAGMARKQALLVRLAPLLRAPVASRRVEQRWNEVLAIADECDVPRRSLVVLAALSAVCVPNGKSPAKRLLKLNEADYSLEHAYNALADLRSLEVLMHLFAMFPKEKLMLCTGDKDLALFWAGIRASAHLLDDGRFEGRFSPVEALFPGVPSVLWRSYFSTEAPGKT